MDAGAVFTRAAAARGQAPALVWPGGRATSFAELEGLSNRAARMLMARGVRKGDAVCLGVDKSPLAYAAMIGCLKIGAPYFFVDPANPERRTRVMAARCRPALAILDPEAPASAFSCEIAVASGEPDREPLLEGFDGAPLEAPWAIEASDPAYVMFTSGSTGEPKGAAISHGNLRHFMAWTRAQLQTRDGDTFSGVNPLFFDNSVFDTYASLFAGAALVPVTTSEVRRPEHMLARLDAARCSIFFSVPSLLVYLQTLKLIDRTAFGTLRVAMFGGEGYPKPRLRSLFEAVGDRIELLNVYGPTECTCIASAYRITADDLDDAPGYAALGDVLAHFTHVIAGPGGAPVAPGETGELYLGGPCVGLGYINDPEQTARAFVEDPSRPGSSDRMYRTGDLVRRDVDDGKLYFVGRADSQIKHQGYRIELGEIEHALASLDGVDEAAAVHLTGGASRIMGIVAMSAGGRGAEVKSRVAALVPSYMVPERIVVMAALPKNANGKIDRPAIRAALERGELA